MKDVIEVFFWPLVAACTWACPNFCHSKIPIVFLVYEHILLDSSESLASWTTFCYTPGNWATKKYWWAIEHRKVNREAQ
jgi:hypothetical protein